MSWRSTPVSSAISRRPRRRSRTGRRRVVERVGIVHPTTLMSGRMPPQAPCSFAGPPRAMRQNGSMAYEFERTQSIAILGGGPGGYEAALAGAQLGAEVTARRARRGRRLGGDHRRRAVEDAHRDRRGRRTRSRRPPTSACSSSRAARPTRPSSRASRSTSPRSTSACSASRASSPTTCARTSSRRACTSCRATAGSTAPTRSSSRPAKGGTDFDRIEADTLVVSVGASPRVLPTAMPDGERILTWTQLYDLPADPRAPHRRRLRRHRRRVRLRLPAPRREGHAHLQPRPGAAR